MCEEEAALNLELLGHLPCSKRMHENEEIVKQQVDVVGTASLYHRLEQSLKDMKVEPLFIKEQWDLYTWRRQFFEEHFPGCECGCQPAWRVLKMTTEPYLVCCKFDEVVALALRLRSDLGIKERQEQIYSTFPEKVNDSDQFQYCILSRFHAKFSSAAFMRFDKRAIENLFDSLYFDSIEDDEDDYYPEDLDFFELQEDFPLSFDDLTAMIAELYPSRVKHPKTLEEIVLKMVLKHGISLEEMSKGLQKQSVMLLLGKISYDDENAGDEKDDFDQDDYDEYNRGSDRRTPILSDQEMRALKKIVSGKGLKISRMARFFILKR